MRSYALRSSVDFGVAPMSSCPRSSDRNGTINGSMITIAIATQRQGWVVTNRAHAPQRPPAAANLAGIVNLGTRSESMWRPIAARIAGSSVIAARTAVMTATADA